MKLSFSLRLLFFVAVCPLALAGAAMRQHAPLLPSPDPANPESYRAFAESVMNAETGDREKQLAIESSIIGAAIAQRQGADQLAASLLITATEICAPDDRIQLWDTAYILDQGIEQAWETHRNTRATTHELAAVLLQNARYGQSLDSDSLSDPEVRSLLTAAAESAGYSKSQLNAILRTLAQRNGSDPCRGRIFTPKRNPETRQIERVLCPEHTRPRAALESDQQFLMLLQIEMALSNIPSSSWSQQDGSGAEPLRDPSITRLLVDYGLSIDRPYLQDQSWVASP